MSMMPPVGLATAPTKPFPTPLKKPVAPSFWAPRKKKTKFQIIRSRMKIETTVKDPKQPLHLPLIGLVTIPVMPLTKPQMEKHN